MAMCHEAKGRVHPECPGANPILPVPRMNAFGSAGSNTQARKTVMPRRRGKFSFVNTVKIQTMKNQNHHHDPMKKKSTNHFSSRDRWTESRRGYGEGGKSA